MTNCGIYKLIDSGEKEAVFWAGVVEIYKFNAHLPFPIGLLDYDDIGEPLRIIDFSDKTSGQKLLHLFHDSLIPFGGENPSLLLDGLLCWIDIQSMLYHLAVNTRHILMSPGEDF